MRFLLRVLAMTLVFSSVSFSQFLTYDPFVLAGADVFSRNLIPLLPDTASQILFHPARAFSTDRRFIYSTYLPSSLGSPFYVTYYQPGPVIDDSRFPRPVNYLPPEYVASKQTSVAAMWGDDLARTLLQVRHTLSEWGSEYNFREQYDSRSNGNSTDRSSSSKSSNSSAGSMVDLKLTRIAKSGSSSQAIGGWVLVRPAGYDVKSNSVSSSINRSTTNPSYASLMFNESDATYTSDFSTYAAGIEYSSSSASMDWRLGISVSKTNTNDHQDIMKTDSSGYLSGTASSSNLSLSHSYFETHEIPLSLSVDLYYSTKQELFGMSGRFFQHIAGGYGKGDVTLDLNVEYQSWNNGSFSGRNTTSKHLDNEIDLQSASFESGWMLQHRAGRTMFVTGMEAQFAYAKSQSVSSPLYVYSFSNYDKLSITTQTSYRGAIITPLIVVYDIADWVSIVGGFNHTWSYERNCRNSPSSTIATVISSGTTLSNSSSSDTTAFDETSTSWSSGVAKYLSIIFTTSEGLRIHIGFTGSLTNYQEWKISAGYLF